MAAALQEPVGFLQIAADLCLAADADELWGRLWRGATNRRILESRGEKAETAGARVVLLHDAFFAQAQNALTFFLGAVSFVLLIGCANVANLLLAAGVARQRELALRAATGADRRRLIRQLLTENLLLSLVAGSVGLALAFWLW